MNDKFVSITEVVAWSAIAIIGVSKREGLEVHALRHLHLLYLLINDAHRLHLHPLHPVAVETVLAGAVHAALHPRRKARTVLFVTFCFLACTVNPFLHFLLPDDRLRLLSGFYLDALRTAELLDALLIECQEAGTGLELAFEVAKTNVIDLPALLVWESLHVLRLPLDASFQRIEGRVGRIGFSVVLSWLYDVCIFCEYLLV